MITNSTSGTNLHEIAPDIYRINTPVALPDGAGFNFNQYLVAEAIGKLLPIDKLRYVAFSHFEADECGSLNDFLAAARDGRRRGAAHRPPRLQVARRATRAARVGKR